MPVGWLLGPKGERVEFEDAPAFFEEAGIMPSYAVKALLDGLETKPSFHVRPSDVNLKFTCRRQRVWMTRHDYGVSPLDLEAMEEGSALHAAYKADEIEVPAADSQQERLSVCGVETRGRIDWLFPERIEDLKTSTPFWITKYGPKGSGVKPTVEIWEPDPKADTDVWRIQLSIYRVLLEKSGYPAPTKGRVWKRWAGVKSDKKRWRRFDFDLLNEAGLEREVGKWMRGLEIDLKKAEVNADSWKSAEPDGLKMIGSKGNYYACDRCPLLNECRAESKLEVF